MTRRVATNKVEIDIRWDRGLGGDRAWRAGINRQIRRMARAAQLPSAPSPVSFRFVDDLTIHALNLAYRKRDQPTDVLAFAQHDAQRTAAMPLGDVILSVESAARQARRKSTEGVAAELLHLAAHGLCHLLGYDHPTAAAERRMNARMAQLLAEGARRGRVAPA